MLVRMKNPPSSLRWNFRGEKNGYRFWLSNTGKLFAEFKTPSGSVWYRVEGRATK